MLRLDNSSRQNPSLWETVLPPEIFQMNEELTRVDKLLEWVFHMLKDGEPFLEVEGIAECHGRGEPAIDSGSV